MSRTGDSVVILLRGAIANIRLQCSARSRRVMPHDLIWALTSLGEVYTPVQQILKIALSSLLVTQ